MNQVNDLITLRMIKIEGPTGIRISVCWIKNDLDWSRSGPGRQALILGWT